jgi:hypothetical protein
MHILLAQYKQEMDQHSRVAGPTNHHEEFADE